MYTPAELSKWYPAQNAAVKERRWSDYIQRLVEELPAIAAASGTDSELFQLAQLETDGGQCPRCGKLWKPVPVDNIFVQGVYYQPACHCYLYCHVCQRFLHHEEANGQIKDNRCPRCRVTLGANWRARVLQQHEEAIRKQRREKKQ